MDLIDAYNINTKGKLLIVSVDHKQDTLILKPPLRFVNQTFVRFS
jgi:hypothetical protein